MRRVDLYLAGSPLRCSTSLSYIANATMGFEPMTPGLKGIKSCCTEPNVVNVFYYYETYCLTLAGFEPARTDVQRGLNPSP